MPSMQFTVEVSREDDGQYRAQCPELGISTLDADLDAAVDRLKTMILEWLTSNAEISCEDLDSDFGFSTDGRWESEYAILYGEDGMKMLYVPRRVHIH